MCRSSRVPVWTGTGSSQTEGGKDRLHDTLQHLVQERTLAEGLELFPKPTYVTEEISIERAEQRYQSDFPDSVGETVTVTRNAPGNRYPLRPAEQYLDTNLAHRSLLVNINGARLDRPGASHLSFFEVETVLCVSFLRSDPTTARPRYRSSEADIVFQHSRPLIDSCQREARSDHYVAPFRASRRGVAADSELEATIEGVVREMLDDLFAARSEGSGPHNAGPNKAWDSQDGLYEIEVKATGVDDLYEYFRGTPLLEPRTVSIYPNAERTAKTRPIYAFRLKDRGSVERVLLSPDLRVVAVIKRRISSVGSNTTILSLFRPDGTRLHTVSRNALIFASPLRDFLNTADARRQCLDRISQLWNERVPFIDPQNRLVIPVADCRCPDDPEAFVEIRVRLEDGKVDRPSEKSPSACRGDSCGS